MTEPCKMSSNIILRIFLILHAVQRKESPVQKSFHEMDLDGKHSWSLQPGTYPRDSNSVSLEEDMSICIFFEKPHRLCWCSLMAGYDCLESLQFQTKTSPTKVKWLQIQQGIGNWSRKEQRNYKKYLIESQEKASSIHTTSLSFCCIWVTLELIHFFLK